MNTGVLIHVNVTREGSDSPVAFQFFSVPKMQAHVVEDIGVKENVTQIYYEIKQVYDVQGDVDEYFT